MSKEQQALASGCVYPAEPMSLECVFSIWSDASTGNFGALSIRKLLKQIDCGVAQFGKPEVGTLTSMNKEEILKEIKTIYDNKDQPQTSATSLRLLLLLIELLKLI